MAGNRLFENRIERLLSGRSPTSRSDKIGVESGHSARFWLEVTHRFRKHRP